MKKTISKQMRLQEWAMDLRSAEESGLSHRQWCNVHNINYSTFKYHNKVLKEEFQSLSEGSCRQLEHHAFAEVPAGLLAGDCEQKNNTDSDNITVEFADTRIVFPVSASVKQIRTVLEVMKNV